MMSIIETQGIRSTLRFFFTHILVGTGMIIESIYWQIDPLPSAVKVGAGIIWSIFFAMGGLAALSAVFLRREYRAYLAIITSAVLFIRALFTIDALGIFNGAALIWMRLIAVGFITSYWGRDPKESQKILEEIKNGNGH